MACVAQISELEWVRIESACIRLPAKQITHTPPESPRQCAPNAPPMRRFVVVHHGVEERRTPGNTLAVQPDKPYQGLAAFGTGAWMDGCVDGWMDVWMDGGWMDGGWRASHVLHDFGMGVGWG